MNPIVDIHREHGVSGYITFIKLYDGEIFKLDSVSLNENGQINSSNNFFSPFHDQLKLTYDSIGRLIEIYDKTDVYNRFRLTYEMYPQERRVIKNLIDVSGNKSELFTRTTVEYNESRNKILREEETNLGSGETTQTVYTYNNNNLVYLFKNSKDSEKKTKFIYGKNNKLVRIEETFSQFQKPLFTLNTFLSPNTGLLDSAIEIRNNEKTIYYYKYF